MWMRVTSAATLALTLSACATAPTRVAFDQGAKSFDEVAVLNQVYQDEIIVRAASSGAAAAGGLIGALVESKVGEGRQNTIDLTMAPFYSAVDDLDFRARLTASLKTALSAKAPFKVATVEQLGRPVPMSAIESRRVTLEKDGRGMLTLMTFYTFTPDYRVLTVTSTANMRKTGAEKPLYLNTYSYQSQPLGGGGAASVVAWAANGGAQYRTAVDQAVEQIAMMLQLDLAAEPVEPAGAPRVTLARSDGVGKPVAGPRLAGGGGRAIVRDADGHLFSLPESNGGQQ